MHGFVSGIARKRASREDRARHQIRVCAAPAPGAYEWAVEYDRHCVGHAGLRVDADQHGATYTVGLFVAELRGRGLGREVTRLVLSWAFGELGVHRVELEVLAFNRRAINCYLACGFRQEGIRREAGLYPDGWKDLILMGLLRSEYAAQGAASDNADADAGSGLGSGSGSA